MPPANSRRVRYLVLAAACSLAVLTYVQRQGFVAGTPYIKKDLGLDDGEMGYLASVWLVAYGAFQVPGGLLGDRLGARHLLTILVLGWSLLAGAVAPRRGFPGRRVAGRSRSCWSCVSSSACFRRAASRPWPACWRTGCRRGNAASPRA